MMSNTASVTYFFAYIGLGNELIVNYPLILGQLPIDGWDKNGLMITSLLSTQKIGAIT